MTYLAFDLDGTIFDVSEVVFSGFVEGIKNFILVNKREDIHIPDYESIKLVLGIPINEIFYRLFPGLSNQELKTINDCCTDSLIHLIKQGGGYIYNRVVDTLHTLREQSYTNFIASNGRCEYILAVLEYYGLRKYFSERLIFLNETIKNKSDIITKYKKIIRLSDQLIMIGDRGNDYIAALENNIPFIGCSFGHAGISEIEKSTCIAHDFTEIPLLVKQIEKNREYEKNINISNVHC